MVREPLSSRAGAPAIDGRVGRAVLVENTAEQFTRFAKERVQQVSPTYAVVAQHVAETPWLLELAAVRRLSRLPELFLASVQFLARQTDDALRPLFEKGITAYRSPGAVTAEFDRFCRGRGPEIGRLVAERAVQTNEPARSIGVLRGLNRAARKLPGRRVHLVELGASAGLQLLPDYYSFELRRPGGHQVVPPQRFLSGLSAPVFTAEVIGPDAGSWMPGPVRIASRRGIDLDPLNCRLAADRLWVESFVWPEQLHRRTMLRRAMDLAAELPVGLRRLDAVAALEQIARQADDVLVVLHSHMIKQLPPGSRAELEELFGRLVAAGKVIRVAVEASAEGKEQPAVGLRSRSAEVSVWTTDGVERVAQLDSHGTWIRPVLSEDEKQ
ncbi:DUF2332 domain-containing protein [Kribbella sp. NPDC051718]|uniref:DUF2332 domain-containing protein n=1 Tax=Kribbella sp. NPDC051718 TaxID=3155168 RepID=UPI00341EC350